MTHKTTILYYCWKPEIQAYSTIDSKGNTPLYWIIGQTLTELFTTNNDCTEGLQLARLKIGCSTIVAFKRINDIKVTIDTITNN